MASDRVERRGRPFLGRTAQVWGRVSPDRRKAIDDLAEDYDVAKAQLVAALLDVAFNHLDEVVIPVKNSSHQGELPLRAS